MRRSTDEGEPEQAAGWGAHLEEGEDLEHGAVAIGDLARHDAVQQHHPDAQQRQRLGRARAVRVEVLIERRAVAALRGVKCSHKQAAVSAGASSPVTPSSQHLASQAACTCKCRNHAGSAWDLYARGAFQSLLW